MPRTCKKYTCPNADWEGCTKTNHSYKGPFERHVLECTARRDAITVEEPGLRALVNKLVKDVERMQSEMRELQLENKQLREQVDGMRVKRSKYNLRKDTVGTPELGWGKFSCEAFVNGLVKARKWYHDQPFTEELHTLGVKSTVIPAAWYFANNAKIVSFDVNGPKNREGNPCYMTINRRAYQRQITTDQCVRKIFETPWLPSLDMLQFALGGELGDDSRERYNWLQQRLRHKPSTENRDFDSYKARVDLLLHIGAYTLPTAPVQLSEEQKESRIRSAKDQWFDDEIQQSGRFWTYCSMQDLIETYELSYGTVESYQKLVHEYLNFDHCTAKKAEYLKLGGQFA